MPAWSNSEVGGGTLILAPRQLPSSWVFEVEGGRREGEEIARGEHFLESLLIRTLILLGQGLTLRTSFNISQAPKRSISKYIHIAGQGFGWGAGFSPWHFVSLLFIVVAGLSFPTHPLPKDMSLRLASAPLFEGKSALKETRS